jgi:hypothetical protein
VHQFIILAKNFVSLGKMLHYVLFFNAICSSEAQFLDKDCVFVCLCVLNLITLSQIKLNLGYGTFS